MADLGFKGLLWLQGGGWMKARTESQRPYEAALITQSWLMPHTETTDTCLRWGFHPPPCLSSWLYCIFMQNILMLWRSKHWFRSYYFFKWSKEALQNFTLESTLKIEFLKKAKKYIYKKFPNHLKTRGNHFCNLIMKTSDKLNHFILSHFCWNVTWNKKQRNKY